MIPFLFVICSIFFFMFICAAILQTYYQKEIAIEYRVDQYFGKSEPIKKNVRKDGNTLTSQTLRKFWNRGVQQVSRSFSRKEQRKLEILLQDAGYTNFSAVEFRFIQLLITIITGGSTFLFMISLSAEISLALLMAISVSFVAHRYTLLFLAKKKTQRIKVINKEMADFFDLVNLLIEAGVGLEGAIAKVCARSKGPLSQEFKVALEEMKLGKSRREAFYSLRKRVPSDGFQSVMMAIIQADHLGIGMSKVIKSLTTRIREQRREAAREQAMKAPVKMLIPMVLFIFPSLFIVILGPMAVKLIVEGL